jgi:hypothetical protein
MRSSRENTGQACGATKHTRGFVRNIISGRCSGAAPRRNPVAVI